MAYEKQTWVCGETITADKLNHMEDGIAEASGGGTAGYECTEEYTLLTDESVATSELFGTAQAPLAYSNLIETNTVKVTFDGVEYVCTKAEQDRLNSYGASIPDSPENPPDWSEYPFIVTSSVDTVMGRVYNTIITQSVGTYQIKLEALNLVATTSPCFKTAVHSVVDEDIESLKPMIVSSGIATVGGGRIEANFIDIYNAFYGGKRVVVRNTDVGNAFEVVGVAKNSNGGGTVISSDGHTYTASTDDDYPSYSTGTEGGGGQN